MKDKRGTREVSRGDTALTTAMHSAFARMEKSVIRVAVVFERMEGAASRLSSQNVSVEAGQANASARNLQSGAEKMAANGDAQLASIRDYNAAVIAEMTRALDTKATVEERYANQSISLAQIEGGMRVQIAADTAGMLANTAQNLSVLLGNKNRETFEAMKAFAIAEALIKGAQIVMSAWNEGAKVNYYYGIALAASAAVAVAAQIEKIRQMKMGDASASISPAGAARPSYHGGSASAYPVPQRIEGEDKQRQDVTINIYNPLSDENWQRIAEENIIPALNNASNRNIAITIRNMGTA
ncbi:MAG: hypothetical protein AABY45_10130 [Deltaproteobacteria bacterium]